MFDSVQIERMMLSAGGGEIVFNVQWNLCYKHNTSGAHSAIGRWFVECSSETVECLGYEALLESCPLNFMCYKPSSHKLRRV